MTATYICQVEGPNKQRTVRQCTRKSQAQDSLVFYYRQDLPQAALPVLFLLTCRFCVFRPAGAIRCTDQGEIWQGGRSSLPHFTLIGSGVGFTAPKLKKWNFTNIISPKGRVTYTIFFTKLQGLCESSVYIILPNVAALF